MSGWGFATELSSLEETLPALLEHGFYPELCPSLCFSLDGLRGYRKARADKDGALLSRHGLTPGWHAYFYNLDLGSVDESIRAYSLNVMLAEIENAHAVGARDMVMHSGYIPVVMDFLFDYWMDIYARSFEKMAIRAQALGIRLLVENVYEKTVRFPQALMARFSGADIGLCFDAGHFFVHGETAPADFARTLHPHIRRMHIHDNDGITDLHWPIGQGKLDYASLIAVFKALGHPPEITFENSGDIQAAALSRQRLAAHWPPPHCPTARK